MIFAGFPLGTNSFTSSALTCASDGTPSWAVVQNSAPPVGSCDVSTFPETSTATHSDTDGHDTPDSPWPREASELLSTCLTVQARAPPAGLVEVTAFPASSTPTHNDCDKHEIA